MLNRDVCLDVIKKALGNDPHFDDRRINSILDEVERRIRLEEARGVIESLEDRIVRSTRDVADEIRKAATLQHIRAAQNVVRREALIERINRFNNPAEGLQAVMVGTQRGIPGARQSIDTSIKAISRQYHGGLLADLRKSGLLEVFNTRSLDLEIARELWEIKPQGRPGITGSPEAQRIAGIIHKWQLAAVERLNRAGAYIKELKGYVVRQSHDFHKITQAGFDQWANYLLSNRLVDFERTFGHEDPIETLQVIYRNIVKGRHLSVPPEELVVSRGPDVAKKASEHRQVHFASAEAWFEYNRRFGSRSFGESVFAGIDQAARHTALLESFGPEPEAMFKTILQDLVERTDVSDTKTLKALRSDRWENYIKELTGEVNAPANNLLARVGRGWRVWNSLSKLGLATISAISDIPMQAAELRYQGVNLLEAYARSVENILSGRRTGWRREFADLLGSGFEGTLGDIHGRFTTDDDLPGAMTKAMQLFFKANGMNWWNDAHKTGAVLMLSRHLARNRDTTFAQLPGDLRRGLSMYGITDRRWEAIRKAAKMGDDGREYISPDSLQSLPDDVIRQAFDAPKAKPLEVLRYRDQLETMLRGYFVDRADYAVLSPGAYERSITQRGTRAGTPLGEAVRLFWQFKQFPITVISRGFGRGVYGKGAESLKDAFIRGKGDFAALAHTMVAMTVMGYVAMAAKELVKGRTPRDPSDPHTWAAAFVQGGGAGILGDFMFGEFNRFGSSFLSSMGGPAAGQIESVAELYAKFRDGDDTAARAVRFAINNTPFINLAYVRPALDYMFLYSVQEALNPGYLRRMERRIREENRQTFLFPPSKYVK